jgi:8-amino-3,8-dideoxy-alpha-D-manno-octulosonate transaminase
MKLPMDVRPNEECEDEVTASTDAVVVTPVRAERLPAEYPSVYGMDEQEVQELVRVARSRSPYRYYGVDPQREVASFEAEFAEFLGVKHVLAVNSGTAALHIALAALMVGPGQEVIVPAYMWVSVVAAVVNLGAIPVLVDIDDTFCLDPEDLRRKITPRTAAVIAVHMNGAMADIVAIREVTRQHKVFLIEDCAQCVGGSIDGQRVGTFGDLAIFSFQINKNMSCGEGGAVATNDERLYRRAIACHDSGYARDDKNAVVWSDTASYSWGRGYRMDELRASVLRVQLRKVDQTISHMARSKYRIREFLATRPQVSLRRIVDPKGDTGCFLITTYKTEKDARAVNKMLRDLGIVGPCAGTSNVILEDYGLHVYFNIPALVMKVGTDAKGSPWTLEENRESNYSYIKGTCPKADDLFERSQILAIPSCLTAEDEDGIIEAFRVTLDRLAQSR